MLVMFISFALAEYAYYIKQMRTKASDKSRWRPAPELDGGRRQVMTGLTISHPLRLPAVSVRGRYQQPHPGLPGATHAEKVAT
jgi:hypothetical protein